MAIQHSSLYILIFLALTHLSIQQTDDPNNPGKIICFGWNGREYPNNTQCPGSYTCCQTADECLLDRFCTGTGGQLIVPACSVFPWNDCANICQYDPGTGLLPRAENCTSDGSFCCQDDPTCCSENRGIVLDGLGGIVSTDGGLTATTSSTATSSSTSLTITTSTSTTSTATSKSIVPTAAAVTSANGAAQTSPSAHSSSGLSKSEITGIAIGAVVIFAIIVGLIVVIFFLYNRRLTTEEKMLLNRPAEPYIGEVDTRPRYQSYYPSSSQPGRGPIIDKSRYVFEAPAGQDGVKHHSVYEMEDRRKE